MRKLSRVEKVGVWGASALTVGVTLAGCGKVAGANTEASPSASRASTAATHESVAPTTRNDVKLLGQSILDMVKIKPDSTSISHKDGNHTVVIKGKTSDGGFLEIGEHATQVADSLPNPKTVDHVWATEQMGKASLDETVHFDIQFNAQSGKWDAKHYDNIQLEAEYGEKDIRFADRTQLKGNHQIAEVVLANDVKLAEVYLNTASEIVVGTPNVAPVHEPAYLDGSLYGATPIQ